MILPMPEGWYEFGCRDGSVRPMLIWLSKKGVPGKARGEVCQMVSDILWNEIPGWWFHRIRIPDVLPITCFGSWQVALPPPMKK